MNVDAFSVGVPHRPVLSAGPVVQPTRLGNHWQNSHGYRKLLSTVFREPRGSCREESPKDLASSPAVTEMKMHTRLCYLPHHLRALIHPCRTLSLRLKQIHRALSLSSLMSLLLPHRATTSQSSPEKSYGVTIVCCALLSPRDRFHDYSSVYYNGDNVCLYRVISSPEF
jgi:hypothetical protein